MQDLIYMNGQAGVKEAAVTLSFDNRDKSKSPAAFIDSDVINVTRKVIVSEFNLILQLKKKISKKYTFYIVIHFY